MQPFSVLGMGEIFAVWRDEIGLKQGENGYVEEISETSLLASHNSRSSMTLFQLALRIGNAGRGGIAHRIDDRT